MQPVAIEEAQTARGLRHHTRSRPSRRRQWGRAATEAATGEAHLTFVASHQLGL